MTKIENFKQLQEARALSRMRIKDLEQQIADDVNALKEDLKPLNLAGQTVRNMLSSHKNGIVGETLGIGINSLVKNLLFRRTNFITKTLIAFAAKNIANNLVAKNSDNIFDWLQSHLKKLKSKHQHNGYYYDESTAGAADMDN